MTKRYSPFLAFLIYCVISPGVALGNEPGAIPMTELKGNPPPIHYSEKPDNTLPPPPAMDPALAPDKNAKAPSVSAFDLDKGTSTSTTTKTSTATGTSEPSTFSESYFYKDENGTLVTVDSLDLVPEKFKAKAKKVRR